MVALRFASSLKLRIRVVPEVERSGSAAMQMSDSNVVVCAHPQCLHHHRGWRIDCNRPVHHMDCPHTDRSPGSAAGRKTCCCNCGVELRRREAGECLSLLIRRAGGNYNHNKG